MARYASGSFPKNGSSLSELTIVRVFALSAIVLFFSAGGALAAAPTITSFTPLSGAPGTAVTITGTNFNATASNNAVYFGAVKATVGSASATSLSVTVPSGATYAPITVINKAAGQSVLSSQPFLPTFSGSGYLNASSILPKADLTTGTTPYAAAIADIDGNGKAELITAGTGSNAVSVFRNTSTSGTLSSASFAAKVDFATAFNPVYAIAVGDLDGDGKLDLVTANYASDSITVLRNTSTSGSITSASFAAAVKFRAGDGPRSIAIADIDGDGKPEIVVVNALANTVSVLRNTSTVSSITTSSFAAKVDFATGSSPYSVAASDIDGDGKADLVVTNYSGNTVSVLRNTSTSGAITSASLAAKVDFAVGSQPTALAIGDINGDGKPDLAVSNYGDNTISIFQNTSTSGTIGSGSFASAVSCASGLQPSGLAFSDMDGDGMVDLITADHGSNTISVLLNTCAGGTITADAFAGKVSFAAGTAPQSVAAGDLDGDGKPDLVSVNSSANTASVFRNATLTVPLPTSPANGATDQTHPLTLQWSTVLDAATYRIQVGTDSTFAGSIVVHDSTLASASKTVSSLGASMTYYWRLCAANAGGAGPFSAVRRFTTMAPTEVASFSPASCATGATVTLSGSGFNATASNNIVYFGAAKAAVTSASATSLSATVPAGATHGPISVLNLATGWTGISDLLFLPTFAGSDTMLQSSLAGKIDLTAGSHPFGMAVGDIDGDGKPDLIAANISANTVSVFRNTSVTGSITSASFAAKTDFATGTAPYAVAVGDLDGDGKLDLVVANYSSSTVSVLKNTSTSGAITAGSFAAKVDFPTATNPRSIAITDIDGDGRPEIVAANIGSASVSVLHNLCTIGSITASSFGAKVDFATGATPNYFAIADMDRDGKPDIVVTNYGSNTVSVLRNTSTTGSIAAGSFAAKVDFAAGAGPTGVAIADIDADGKPDICVANTSSNSLSILKNTASSGTITAGSFAAKVDFPTSGAPFGLAVADMSGDGRPDIVVANSGGGSVSVFRNTSAAGLISSGSLALRFDFAAGTTPETLIAGDLDGDGKPDIAAANYGSSTVSVFRNAVAYSMLVYPRNQASGQPLSPVLQWHISPGAVSYRLQIGTDSTFLSGIVEDVAALADTFTTVSGLIRSTIYYWCVTAQYSGGGSVRSNIAQFTTIPQAISSISPLSGPAGTSVTINGEGFNPTASNNVVYFGAARAAVTAASAASLTVTTPTGSTYAPVSVTDLTSGITGIAASPFQLLFADSGSVKLRSKVDLTGGANPYSMTVGDIDGDGKPDLIAANTSGNTVSVFRNTSTVGSISTGSFTAKTDFATGTGPYAVAVGDLDGDGKLDLVIANYYAATVSVLRNTSTSGTITAGSFAAKVDFQTAINPRSVAIADIDGDGKPEIVAANAGSNSISVLRNTGMAGSISSGSFGAKVDFAAGTYPYSLTAADMDGDGKPDVVVTNYNSNTVSVLRNTSRIGFIEAGSFAAKVDYATGTGPTGVATADIDADGKPEICVSNYGGSTLSVFQNTSTSGTIAPGSFSAKVDFTTMAFPFGLAVADMSGDGRPDIVVANNGSNTVSVFHNMKSSGGITAASLGARVDAAAGTTPETVIAADLDGDGKPDIAAANYSSNTISVFKNITVQSPLISPSNYSTDQSLSLTLLWHSVSGAVSYRVQLAADSNFVTGMVVDESAVTDTFKTVALLNGGTAYYWRLIITRDDGTDTTASSMFRTSMQSITSFAPQSGPVGTTVTIRGTGFNSSPSNNIVVFGAVRASATAATDSTLTVSVPPGATYATLSVTDATTRLTAAAGQPFVPTFPGSSYLAQSSFEPKIDLPFPTDFLESGPERIAMADLDGDGKLDLVVPDNATGSLAVFRNTGADGISGAAWSASKISIPLNYWPDDIAIGDIDGDGKPDIVTVEAYDKVVSVLRNIGTAGSLTAGSFAPEVHFSTTASPSSVSIGDLDGDGIAELIVANQSANTVTVLKNISPPGSITTNSFALKVDFPTGYTPSAVAASDVDGDGKPDLIVTNQGSNTVSVLRNTHTIGPLTAGSFAAKVDFATGSSPSGMAIADVNADGKPDLCIADYNSDMISVLKNTSTSGSITAGSFAAKADTRVGSYPMDLVAADINGDGYPDLVVTNYQSNSISLLRNISSDGSAPAGSFAAAVNVATGSSPRGLAVGDLDGDGRPDLACANYDGSSVSLIRNVITNSRLISPGNGALNQPISLTLKWLASAGAASYHIQLGTDSTFASGMFVNATAVTDTFMTVSGLSGFTAYFWRVITVPSAAPEDTSSTSKFTTIPHVLSSFTPHAGVVGTSVTITGSGFNEVASNNIVYFGGARGTVTAVDSASLTVQVPSGGTYSPICVTDASTGATDFTTAPFMPTFPGGGYLTAPAILPKSDFATGTNPYDVATGDLDGDGKPDLVVTNFVSGTVSILRNTGTTGSIAEGSFAPAVNLAVGSQPIGVAVADLDADGRLDIIAANNGNGTISILKNKHISGAITAASFATRVNLTIGTHPFSVAVGDIDGDGRPDIAVSDNSWGDIAILRNLGMIGNITSASFGEPVSFSTNSGIYDIALADIDGDGRSDLIAANGGAGTISVLRNTATAGLITGTSFANDVEFSSGGYPVGLAVGDLDGDGKPDVIVTNYSSSAISVLRNTAATGSITTGSLAARVTFATRTAPRNIAIGDLDGDGKPDLVVANASDSTVSILRNTAVSGSITASSFAPKVDAATGNGAFSAAVADMDGDGKPDIIAVNEVNSTVSVLRNTVLTSPALMSPACDSTINDSLLTLRWNATLDAASYRVQCGTDSTFAGGILFDTTAVADTSLAISGLASPATYFWRVSATNAGGTGKYAVASRFTTGAVLPVGLSSLVVRSDPRHSRLVLEWKTATESGNYGFDVERSAVGAGIAPQWKKIGFVKGAGTTNAPQSYAHTDGPLLSGRYAYRLKQIDRDGRFTYSQTVEAEVAAPKEFALEQNYPNPFNPSTTIQYAVPRRSNVTLTLYNTLGAEVLRLAEGPSEPGVHQAVWNAGAYSSGIYFCVMRAEGFTRVRKLMLIK